MKSTLILIIGLLLTSSVFAQNKWVVGPVVSLGFSGEREQKFEEYTYTSSSSTSLEESKLLPSIGTGFFAECYLSENWSIGFGVEYNYVQRFDRIQYKGYGILGNLTSYGNNRRKLATHQLQAPLQTRFYLKKKDEIRPYLSLGGLVTYAFTATQTVFSSSLFSGGQVREFSSAENYDMNSEYSPVNRFNISAFYGIGIDFKSFAIELNHSRSVLNENPESLYYRLSFRSINDPTPPRQTRLTRILIRYKFSV